jgi:hypothetical protein
VHIVSQDGTIIEQGQAVEVGVYSGTWTYTAARQEIIGAAIHLNEWLVRGKSRFCVRLNQQLDQLARLSENLRLR